MRLPYPGAGEPALGDTPVLVTNSFPWPIEAWRYTELCGGNGAWLVIWEGKVDLSSQLDWVVFCRSGDLQQDISRGEAAGTMLVIPEMQGEQQRSDLQA